MTLGKKIFSGTLITGFILGIIFWGGFNWTLELTNSLSFCTSCHEMRDNVYPEYQNTVHYSNRTGVRAECPDCHVPREWIHKIIRKVEASRELYHKVVGTIDTPEKFEQYRLTMALSEWKRMKSVDSRECRNCHDYESMDFVDQGRRAVKAHSTGLDEGKTCIDCHKGIAHQLPKGWEEAAAKAGL